VPPLGWSGQSVTSWQNQLVDWALAAILVACLAGLYGLHRLALWAESKGWIYYRTKRMPPGAAGMAMMEVAQVFEPGIEHVVEELRSETVRGEATDTGDTSDSDGGPLPQA
jgi:hypothetical protein